MSFDGSMMYKGTNYFIFNPKTVSSKISPLNIYLIIFKSFLRLQKSKIYIFDYKSFLRLQKSKIYIFDYM